MQRRYACSSPAASHLRADSRRYTPYTMGTRNNGIGLLRPAVGLHSLGSSLRRPHQFWDELVWVIRVLVAMRLLPVGQFHLLALHLLIRDVLEQVADEVEPCLLLFI